MLTFSPLGEKVNTNMALIHRQVKKSTLGKIVNNHPGRWQLIEARSLLKLVAGCWLLVAGCWSLVAGSLLKLVAGCWLLVAGCWVLVAGSWSLEAY